MGSQVVTATCACHSGWVNENNPKPTWVVVVCSTLPWYIVGFLLLTIAPLLKIRELILSILTISGWVIIRAFAAFVYRFGGKGIYGSVTDMHDDPLTFWVKLERENEALICCFWCVVFYLTIHENNLVLLIKIILGWRIMYNIYVVYLPMLSLDFPL